jgi:hypothetical protein
LYALKKQYYPFSRIIYLSIVTRKITSDGFNFKPVVYEVDSTREVYFIANRTGYTGIYRKDLDKSSPEELPIQVIQGEQSDEFEAFHPFRSKIDISKDGVLAFVTKSGGSDALHLYDVNRDRIVETFRFGTGQHRFSFAPVAGWKRIVFLDRPVG